MQLTHTHRLPARGRNGQQVLPRSDGLRLPCLLRHYGKLLKMRFFRKRGKLRIFFGKVPHSPFTLRGHVCINTEDPTLVIIMPPHSIQGKNFGALKFGKHPYAKFAKIYSLQYFLLYGTTLTPTHSINPLDNQNWVATYTHLNTAANNPILHPSLRPLPQNPSIAADWNSLCAKRRTDTSTSVFQTWTA